MKKIGFAMALALLLIAGCAQASVTDMDSVCVNRGFAGGVAKWSRDNVTDSFFLAEEIDGAATTVVGNGNQTSWTSSPAVLGVVSREGKIVYQVFAGGESGEFSKKGNVEINAVFFCDLDSSGAAATPGEVPEFGTVATVIAIAGAAACLFILRKP